MARRRRRGPIAWLLAPVRLNWYRALRSSEGSRYLAGGLGLGVFVAVYPIFLLHFPVAWGLAQLFRLSKSAATAGALVSNALTVLPIFSVVTAVGVAVTPNAPPSPLRDPRVLLRDPGAIAELSWVDVSTLFNGATVVGVISGALTYTIALRWVEGRSRRRSSWRRVRAGRSDG